MYSCMQVYDFPSTADPWAILEATNKDELAGFEYTIQVGGLFCEGTCLVCVRFPYG
jgi:hypothetical protein